MRWKLKSGAEASPALRRPRFKHVPPLSTLLKFRFGYAQCFVQCKLVLYATNRIIIIVRIDSARRSLFHLFLMAPLIGALSTLAYRHKSEGEF